MKQYIPLFEDYSAGDYPPGAANDPSAPYNQSTEETDFDTENFTVSLIEPFNEKKLINVALIDDDGNTKLVPITFEDLFNFIKEYDTDFVDGDEIVSVDNAEEGNQKSKKFLIVTKNGVSSELYTDDYALMDYLNAVI